MASNHCILRISFSIALFLTGIVLAEEQGLPTDSLPTNSGTPLRRALIAGWNHLTDYHSPQALDYSNRFYASAFLIGRDNLLPQDTALFYVNSGRVLFKIRTRSVSNFGIYWGVDNEGFLLSEPEDVSSSLESVADSVEAKCGVRSNALYNTGYYGENTQYFERDLSGVPFNIFRLNQDTSCFWVASVDSLKNLYDQDRPLLLFGARVMSPALFFSKKLSYGFAVGLKLNPFYIQDSYLLKADFFRSIYNDSTSNASFENLAEIRSNSALRKAGALIAPSICKNISLQTCVYITLPIEIYQKWTSNNQYFIRYPGWQWRNDTTFSSGGWTSYTSDRSQADVFDSITIVTETSGTNYSYAPLIGVESMNNRSYGWGFMFLPFIGNVWRVDLEYSHVFRREPAQIRNILALEYIACQKVCFKNHIVNSYEGFFATNIEYEFPTQFEESADFSIRLASKFNFLRYFYCVPISARLTLRAYRKNVMPDFFQGAYSSDFGAQYIWNHGGVTVGISPLVTRYDKLIGHFNIWLKY